MSKFQNKYTTETAKEYVQQFGCILNSEYKGMNEKHEFICKCGNHFTTTFAKFQNRNKRQCNICGRNRRAEESKLSFDEVKQYMERYGCELLSTTYTNSKDKNLLIKCHCGNTFTTSLSNFRLSKHQCNDCSRKDANQSKNKYTVDFVAHLCEENDAKLLEYQANGKYINTHSKITIKCNECGKSFTTSLEYILFTNKFICNDCAYEKAPSSNGELLVKSILDKMNMISYKEQYSFEDCRDKQALRFDFAIFKNSKLYLIEWDGIQHFKPYDYYGGMEKYLDVVHKDSIKNSYCLRKNIPLLRLKYDDTDVENKIREFLVA